MNYEKIDRSLEEATKELDLVVDRRETLIKESREVISYSSKAIIAVHSSEFKEAERLKKLAREKLFALQQIAEPDLKKYLTTPEQEYVECAVLIALSLKRELPSKTSLGVSMPSYILGLLDGIGELKRRVYDCIRKDDYETAEEMFSIMQQLFIRISPLAVYDHVINGVRRKLDVARILIEETRATVTEESRRREFITALNSVSDKLGAVSSKGKVH